MGGVETLIAIGVGCRKDCSAEEIVKLVEETVAALPARREARGLFSIATKRGEVGLVEAAARLGLPLAFFDTDVLQTFSEGTQTFSARVDRMHGLPSVAETAALAGAGEGAVLLVARHASAGATCAIAGDPG